MNIYMISKLYKEIS